MKIPMFDINNKALKAMTVVIFIYPIIPLAILSVLVVLSGLVAFVGGTTIPDLFSMLYMYLWVLGGAAGFVGMLKILSNNRTIFSLLLFVWGAVSYSIVAVFFIRGSMQTPDFFSILHAIYLLVSLFVIGVQLILTIQSIRKGKISTSLN